MKVIGEMICSMAMELKHGLMDQSMKVTIMKERSMAKERTLGVTEVAMLVIGLTIKSMDKGFIPG